MSSLKFIAISGSTGVTENLYIYESGNDMIVVDCGIGFPDADMPGIDLVLPDFSYVKKNIKKLRGVLITHGHEDHLGGLPFFLKEIDTDVYASKLTAGFIEDKMQDYKVKSRRVKVFDPEKDTISLGVFKITPFRVAHSVPDAVGFCIDTPQGKAFHVPDYKFDWTPVDGKPFDVGKLSMLASGGALLLASDSLGSTSTGNTESEAAIEDEVMAVARKAQGQIFLTTTSSNISRIQQSINVAVRLGRKVTFNGRSIERKTDIAQELGYLKIPKGAVIDGKKSKHLPKNKVLHIIAGTYGQQGSGLHKATIGKHNYLKIRPYDTVIFSGDPSPPGAKYSVDLLVNKLIEMNVDVHYYDLQEDLHVSGHGSQGDIKLLFGLVKPKFFIPIGGTTRHNREYSKIAQSMGAKRQDVFELIPGEGAEFNNSKGKRMKPIAVKEVYLDGFEAGDVGSFVLRDRQILANEGVAIVVIKVDMATKKLIEDPEIISRGFVFEKTKKSLLITAGKKLAGVINKNKISDAPTLKKDAVNFLEKHFWNENGRRPMILPVVIEV